MLQNDAVGCVFVCMTTDNYREQRTASPVSLPRLLLGKESRTLGPRDIGR